MLIKIVMPQLGISTLEGTITAWLKKEGELVVKGEPLFEIETDKATMEVESLGSGILKKILVHAGDLVKVTEEVAILADDRPDAVEVTEVTINTDSELAGASVAESAAQTAVPGRADTPEGAVSDRRHISPLARKIAAGANLSPEALNSLVGTGADGAITKSDVLKYVAERPEPQVQIAPPLPLPTAALQQEIIPLSRMRRAIADRMTFSVREAPQFWLESEVNFTEVIKLRESMNKRLADRGIALTYTDILVKAVAGALRESPFMNASYSAAGIVRKPEVNVGIAVALEEGLIVPVIRDADKKPLSEIAVERCRLSENARKGALTEQEISGGTFTVSNLGMFKVDRFAAILNPPEAGILSVGRIRKNLELRDGQVASVPTVSLGLTIDHRCVDGAQGAQFLERVIERLQEPYLLLV